MATAITPTNTAEILAPPAWCRAFGARAPELVLLPDEPYRFGETEREELGAQGLRAELVCGKDLFWYGVRAAGALERVRAYLEP